MWPKHPVHIVITTWSTHKFAHSSRQSHHKYRVISRLVIGRSIKAHLVRVIHSLKKLALLM